jgi:hypothetical protein
MYVVRGCSVSMVLHMRLTNAGGRAAALPIIQVAVLMGCGWCFRGSTSSHSSIGSTASAHRCWSLATAPHPAAVPSN